MGSEAFRGTEELFTESLQKHQNREHKHLSLNGVPSSTFPLPFCCLRFCCAAAAGSPEINCTICISNTTISYGVLGLKILQRGDEQQLNNNADVS